MTAAEYRARAVQLLTNKQGFAQVPDRAVREAAVWADLATSAAISEQTAKETK